MSVKIPAEMNWLRKPNNHYHHLSLEGYDKGGWILMDYNDVIIHVFDRQNRLFYDLERIWKGGSLVEL